MPAPVTCIGCMVDVLLVDYICSTRPTARSLPPMSSVGDVFKVKKRPWAEISLLPTAIASRCCNGQVISGPGLGRPDGWSATAKRTVALAFAAIARIVLVTVPALISFEPNHPPGNSRRIARNLWYCQWVCDKNCSAGDSHAVRGANRHGTHELVWRSE